MNSSSSKNPKTTEKKFSNVTTISGWIAAILFLIGIIWLLGEKYQLKKAIDDLSIQNSLLIDEKKEVESKLSQYRTFIDVSRSPEFQTVMLQGNQAVAPQAFAKIYWNKKENLGYVDVRGLPPLPDEKTYQLWTLNMDPFNASKIGTIYPNSQTENELVKFENFPEFEVLCITLEDEDGSKSPTMSQIYVMTMTTED